MERVIDKKGSSIGRFRDTKQMKKKTDFFITIGVLLIVLIIWEIVTRFIIKEPIIAPGPQLTFAAFWEVLIDGRLLQNIWASLYRVLFGFILAVIVGIPVGFAMGWFPMVRKIFEPFVQFFRVIPPIALIPLLIIYLGIGETAKISIIWLAAFLAIVIAVYQGVKEVDPILIRAARVMGAKNEDLFFDVVVPGSLPYILVGMRLGLANAWGSLVAAELIAASKGLGYMIISAQADFQVPIIVVGIIMIGLIGICMDKMILVAQRRFSPWRRE